MHKIRLTFLISIVIFGVAGWSCPALADKYADTIAVFKKSEAVQPFFDNALDSRFSPKGRHS